MQEGKARARMERPVERGPDLPHLRMRIVVSRFDFGSDTHVIELYKTARVDQYRVEVDGRVWAQRAGITRVLESIRKALPRVASPRAKP